MNVKDLIHILNFYPQDLAVLVDGYEGGLIEIDDVKKVNVNLNTNKEDFYGPHEEDPQGEVECILIRRDNLR